MDSELSYAEIIRDFSKFIGGDEPSKELLEHIIPGGTLDPRSALEVYAEGYQARTHEALLETFETVAWLLGDEAFNLLSHLYSRDVTSESSNIYFLCKHFPGFLRNSDLAHTYPFLPDLARFEWTFSEVFHETRAKFQAPTTSSISEESRFTFTPSFRIFESKYAVHKIWENRGKQQMPLEIPINTPAYLTLLHGSDGLVQIHSWAQDELDVIKNLKNGFALGAAAKNLVIENPEAFFTSLFSAGFLNFNESQDQNGTNLISEPLG